MLTLVHFITSCCSRLFHSLANKPIHFDGEIHRRTEFERQSGAQHKRVYGEKKKSSDNNRGLALTIFGLKKEKENRGKRREKKERKKEERKSTAACVSVRVWIASEAFRGFVEKTCRPLDAQIVTARHRRSHQFFNEIKSTGKIKKSEINSKQEMTRVEIRIKC